MTKQVIYFLIFLNFLIICIVPPQEETVNARTKRMVKATSLKKIASQILLIFSNILWLWGKLPGLENGLNLILLQSASQLLQKNLQMSPSGKRQPSYKNIGEKPVFEGQHFFQHFCFCSCDNCSPVNVNDNLRLRLNCAATCPDVTWHIEDPKLLQVECEIMLCCDINVRNK